MNPKTKRRLSILLAAAVAGSCALGGLFVYRKQRAAAYYANLRKVGLAEYAANDYHGALNHLASYIRRSPNDSEALYACAESRLHVEEANHAELPVAIGLLRSFVELNPDRKDAREQLLDLYLKAGYLTETIATAKQVLDYDHGNPKALIARARANFFLRKYKDAYTDALEYNKVAPLDLEGQSLTLTIMQRQGAAPEDILARTDQLLASHPDDSRFELLKSAGYIMTGDVTSAKKWALTAAKHPGPDPVFLKTLIRHLDSLGLFDDAKDLQEKAARNNPDAQTRDNWIARLLQSGQYDEVVDVVSKEKELDTDLLFYKALALIYLDRSADAQSVLSLLADRGKSDSHAAAAANAIDKTLLHPSDPAAAISACNDALGNDIQDPFFVHLLAKAYALSGESELAEEHYKQAAIIAPAWAQPLTALSKLYLNQGRVVEAYGAASQARARSPKDREALLDSATSGVYLITPGRTDQFKDLLEFVRKIETQFPDEQRIIPVHVLALAGLNQKTEALAVLSKSLAPDFKADPETLLTLAGASANAKLGQEEACFSRYQQLYGLTPELAFARAAWLASTGHPDDGLKYLDESQAHQTDPSPAWKINHARYLDLTNNSQAKKEWETLAENNPKDVKIQWQAIGSHSTQDDRPFIAATIERLRTLRGDRGAYLSIVRARYILQGKPIPEKDLAEAVLLLSDVIRQNPKNPSAHQLLAAAYFSQNNVSQGIEELTQAVDLAPDSFSLSLELARALHSQRNFARARPYIDRVAQNKALSDDQRRLCTVLLAEEGDLAAATHQLEQIPASNLTVKDRISLASFYAQINQPAKADALVSDLLKQPTPEAIQLASEFYRTQKRDEDAKHALALLDSIDCPPAAKARIRASFNALSGDIDGAIQLYLQATKSNPKDGMLWRQLIKLCILAGRVDDVDRYVGEAHAALPDDEAFTTLTAALPILHKFGMEPALRPTFAAIIESSPTDANAIVDALKLFVSVTSGADAPNKSLTQLQQAAGNAPDNLQVQTLAARAFLLSGKLEDGISIASRAAFTFPTAAEPAELATEGLIAANKWNEAAPMAAEWRKRAQNAPLAADLASAQIKIQLNNFQDALDQVQPYLPIAMKGPESNPLIIILYVQALVDLNRTEDAAKLLQPLMTSSKWRLECIFFAVRLPNERDAQMWLQRVAAAIPSDAAQEKIELAIGYNELAGRTHNPTYTQKAVEILEPMATGDYDPKLLPVLGSCYEAQSNFTGAERVYRLSLRANPDQPIVLNNLAMILSRQSSNLPEALEDVSKAIQLNPKFPNFYDTRAVILAAQKKYPEAMNDINAAMNIAPDDPQWKASRIWLLALSGKSDDAATEFQEFRTTQNVSSLPDEVRHRLKSVGLQ